jgi:hypothetical protein
MTGKQSLFIRHIAVPQDHGSWVFILSPLVIGIFAGGHFTLATFFFVISAMAVFMMRQPVTVTVKVYAGRRPRTDLPAARFWMLVYGSIALAALVGLVLQGFLDMLYLAIPGVPVFAWHLYLVSRRAERKQAGVEVVATGVLSLAAPAAYWIGRGLYDPLGWALWLLTWLQSAASIVYTYLRLEQRPLTEKPSRLALWKMGRRALLYTSFNLALSLAAGLTGFLPGFIFIPFLLQWVEALWGITHPAIGGKPTRIGLRQLLVSTLFTVLFVLAWRF